MVRPVTRTEVLLQQIGDSLEEIAGLLRQAQPAPAPEPDAKDGPVQVDGMGDNAPAETPKPAKKAAPRKRAAKKSSTKPVKGD